MKIGVLTLALHTNYGGILQAYALQTVLKRMGHEVMLIEKNNPENWFSPRRLAYLIRSANTRCFVNKRISMIRVEQFSVLTDLDAVIVGSDQVWRPLMFSEATDPFLGFASEWDIKRIAYAASFGLEEWGYNSQTTACCTELIDLFDAVSVREESAQLLCSRYLGRDALLVLDPTMLLGADDYKILFENAPVSFVPGSLCTYILDENADKVALIQQISQIYGMNSVVELGAGPSVRGLSALMPVPSVEHWVRGFQEAGYIVTDSFHACVFSILFHKPFVVYGNAKRGMARFHSLLKLFGLQDRLVSSSDQCVVTELKPIDWDEVDKRLNEMKRLSEAFLLRALNQNNQEATEYE